MEKTNQDVCCWSSCNNVCAIIVCLKYWMIVWQEIIYFLIWHFISFRSFEYRNFHKLSNARRWICNKLHASTWSAIGLLYVPKNGLLYLAGMIIPTRPVFIFTYSNVELLTENYCFICNAFSRFITGLLPTYIGS